MILGITGGIGCGKSAVAGLLERAGFRRLDSDAVVRDQVLTRPEIVAQVRERFGAGVVAPDGSLDRARMGQRVFAVDSDRLWLEELTHPVLFQLWRETLAAFPEGPWAVEV